MATRIEAGEYMTAAEAAELAGVKTNTFSTYAKRGQAPAPAYEVGQERLYRADEVRAWVKNRPGPGARTDLRKPAK